MFLYIRSITGDSIASRNAIYKYHNGPLGGHCSNRNTVLKKFISVAGCLNTANFKRKNSIFYHSLIIDFVFRCCSRQCLYIPICRYSLFCSCSNYVTVNDFF